MGASDLVPGTQPLQASGSPRARADDSLQRETLSYGSVASRSPWHPMLVGCLSWVCREIIFEFVTKLEMSVKEASENR